MSSVVDSFGGRGRLGVGDAGYEIFRLPAVGGADRLPFGLKVLMENLEIHFTPAWPAAPHAARAARPPDGRGR